MTSSPFTSRLEATTVALLKLYPAWLAAVEAGGAARRHKHAYMSTLLAGVT